MDVTKQLVVWVLSLVSCGAAVGCGGEEKTAPAQTDACGLPEAEIPSPPIHTPRWAFEPWISKDISTTADMYDFVDGFRSRDIPVGVVVLDSPWETNYHSFVPNPSRYPDFDKLVADFHADDIRVVLWMTQMVNYSSFDYEQGGDIYEGPSPNYQEGEDCKFYVNDGELYTWWKGVGAAVDFFDPRARAWWHRQQDALFELGIDGWKLDFGDSYVPTETVQTEIGPVPHQQYSEEYYRDFLAYGVSKRGPEDFVTMVRPWDESYGFSGRFFARKEHAPVAWVGDNRRDWVGLTDALDHMFKSAAAGYVMLGSDVGGYLDRDDKTLQSVPFDGAAFDRWVAVGALSPFMQLHGRANLAPWTVPEDPEGTVARYRYWATLHHELVPFFYSLAEKGHAEGQPMLHPQGAETDWVGDYRYMLGEALLVAPILDGAGTRDIELPAGARFYDWWNPAGDALEGGQTLAAYDSTDRARIPLFIKEGAIIPMSIGSGTTAIGRPAWSGHRTILVYPGPQKTSFTVYDEDGQTTDVEALSGPMQHRVTLSRSALPSILRLRTEQIPSAVQVNGTELMAAASQAALDAATSGWFSDPIN